MHHTNTLLFLALFLPAVLSGMADSFFDTISPFNPITKKNPLHNRAIYTEESLATLKSVLAEKKYDVNEKHGNTTPLGLAIEADNVTAVSLLLENGADPNKPCNGLRCLPTLPLTQSFRSGTIEIAALLLQKGANPNLELSNRNILFTIFSHRYGKKQLEFLALLLRAGLNPVSACSEQVGFYSVGFYSYETIFQYTRREGTTTSYRTGSDCLADYYKERDGRYKQGARSLVQYKILWNHLHRNWGLPAEIAQHVLTFVDFGLDDYHIPMAECAICYDEKKFAAIPCSKNTHPDSICSDCIGKITDCPLCREPLNK